MNYDYTTNPKRLTTVLAFEIGYERGYADMHDRYKEACELAHQAISRTAELEGRYRPEDGAASHRFSEDLEALQTETAYISTHIQVTA